ncbi:MAG: S8 family serine peptidase [Luteolibacter sp.]|nr:S8 family serine peptidase [Luteolibacter sp.]
MKNRFLWLTLALLLLLWIWFPKAANPGSNGDVDSSETPVSETATGGVETADEEISSAAPDASAVGASPRQTRGRWVHEIPRVDDYLDGVPPGARADYITFQAAYPQFDPTDREQFAQALIAKRATYPDTLGERDSVDLSAWLEPMEAMQKALIAARAAHIGIEVDSSDADGRFFTLVGFAGQTPLYLTAQNVNAAASIAANLVRLNATFDPALGATVGGAGQYVNANDHGTIYEHAEFQLPGSGGSRIVLKEVNDSGNRSHMTHVTGTVAAWGYNSSLIGMAPRLWIRSLIQQNTSDITLYGMLFPGQKHSINNPRTGQPELKSIIGTTSLGYDLEFHDNCIYSYTAASFDTTLRDYPYYTHFFAASNNGPNYLTLGNEWPMCKNLFTIGSVDDVARGANGDFLSGGAVSSFSARGPAFDGRIKPDLTANGSGLTSTDSTSGQSAKSGTSMATPNASGSAALLVDYISRKLPGHYVRSSTLKALLVNTATDRGNAGPDYFYGWGVMNVKAAAEIVKRYAENPVSRVLLEDELSPDETWTATYQYDGSGPIRACLAWIDPAGTGQSSGTTNRSPRLVNDLDLRIISRQGTIHQPYVMPFTTGSGGTPAYDTTLYSATATTGGNFTDNVEQVHLASPPAGTYTVLIKHGGSLQNGNPQKFSLAVTGMAQDTAIAPEIASITPVIGNATDNFLLTVNGGGFLLGSDVILRRAGSADVTAYGVMPVDHQILCRIDSAAMARGYWDVVVRAPGGSEAVLANGLLMPADVYANGFENGVPGLILGAGWAVGVPGKGAVGGPDSAWKGNSALITYAGGAYPSNVNTYATLPAISTIGRSGIQLSFQRFLGLAYNRNVWPPSLRHEDFGRIEFSTNNSNWTNVYANGSAVTDSNWALRTYSLPGTADDQASLYFRFQLQTDTYNNSFGWCIDDLKVTSTAGVIEPPAFTSTPPATASAGESFAYTATTSDPDTPGTGLTLGVSALPAGLAFTDHGDGTGTLAGTSMAPGTSTISITVTDGFYTTYQIFDLAVNPMSNTASAISPIYDLTIPAGGDTGALAFSIYDAETEPTLLEVSGSSSNQDLVPDANIIFGGEGAARTVTVSPAAYQTGTAVITVTVSDGDLTSQIQFTLTVEPTFESWIQGEEGVGDQTGSNDDPDHDGIVNLIEYALGGLAAEADLGILPVGRISTHGESHHLEIVIGKNSAATGIQYVVEVSGDLIVWHAGPEHTTVVEETGDSLIVYDNAPADEAAPQRFMRLRVARD